MFRRVLLLFIAVLLPLQLAWGAVSGYCQHESGARTQHIGHHEHVHKADAKKGADLKVAPDNDCGTCHGTGAGALIAAVAGVPTSSPRMSITVETQRAPLSNPSDTPERPQWPRPA